MTCNILTKGHVLCLEYLKRHGSVTIGLLTAKALSGYKKEVMPFKERRYILETIALALGNIKVVPQDSLNPTDNIKKYKCNAIASGDGFEKEEMESIKKLKLQIINIKLRNEKTKMFSSSKILNNK